MPLTRDIADNLKTFNTRTELTVLDYNRIGIPEKPSRPKSILFYTTFFQSLDYGIGFGKRPFESCEVSNCFTTANKSLMPIEDFDSIIFHMRNMNGRVPPRRRKNQKYVMFMKESPIHDRFNYSTVKGNVIFYE